MLKTASAKKGCTLTIILLTIVSLISLVGLSVAYLNIFQAYNLMDVTVEDVRAFPLDSENARFEIILQIQNQNPTLPIVIRTIITSVILNNVELVYASSSLGFNTEVAAGSNNSVAISRNFKSIRDFNRLIGANNTDSWSWRLSFEIYFDIAFLEGSRRSYTVTYSGNSVAPFTIP